MRKRNSMDHISRDAHSESIPPVRLKADRAEEVAADTELLLRQLNISTVMPDLIRHPGQFWIPVVTRLTALTYIVAEAIMSAQMI